MISDLRVNGTNNLRTDFLLPKTILFQADGIRNADALLQNKNSQPHTGVDNMTVFSTENGEKAAILLDFGSEFAGGAAITVNHISLEKEVEFIIRFGESAAEAMADIGQKGACNDHSVRNFKMRLPQYSRTVIGKTGYRFLYLELSEKETTVKVSRVEGVFTYRDIPYLGSFSCDQPVFNQIYDISAYTVHLCMQEMLWDGIKRDRLVWVGDMHPEILTIRSVFGDQKIVDDSLRLISKEFPFPHYPNDFTTYGMWYFLILWDWYCYNGRMELICELREYWKPLLNSLLTLIHDKSDPFDEAEFEKGFFLDWPTYETKEAESGVCGLFILALQSAEKICFVTGETSLGNICSERIRILKNTRYEKTAKKQIAAVRALAGMDDEALSTKVLTKGNGRGMSPFMSYYILSATAKTAGVSAALSMLKEYYGGMIKAGATTFWEDFDLDWLKNEANITDLPGKTKYDIHGDNGKYCYQGFRHSLCHGWSGAPAAFLAEEVLGVKILEPGCKKIAVKPGLGDLKWAKGTYPTPYGVIDISAYKKKDETIDLKIDSPKGIEVITG